MTTFRSIDEFKRHYFPKAHAKKQLEKRIKKHGLMRVLLDDLQKELTGQVFPKNAVSIQD